MVRPLGLLERLHIGEGLSEVTALRIVGDGFREAIALPYEYPVPELSFARFVLLAER